MARSIFVNLAVEDLARSMTFFRAIGFTFNEQFTDETAACLVIGEGVFAMLLTQERFRDFTNKEVADPHKTTEVMTGVSAENRAEVDRIVDAALAAGATKVREPEDHGFMYGRSFNDPDGHIWEVFWMDPKQMKA